MVAETIAQNGTGLGANEFVVPADSVLNQIPNKTWRPEGSNGVFDAMVPLELIARDAVPLYSKRVEGMRELLLHSRRGAGVDGTGVYDSILLCEVPRKGLLYVADGFHRQATVLSLNAELSIDYNQPEIFATIVPNCTEEDVLDLRIASASEHGEVSFARASLWILDFWKTKTEWNGGLSAAQAFALAGSGTNGEGFGLSKEVADEIRSWAIGKSKLWGVKVLTLAEELRVASMSAPDLVSSVRPRGGGSKLEALTAEHLKTIANARPGERNWGIQRAVKDYVLAYNLPAPKTRALMGLIEGCRTSEAVEAALESIRPAELVTNNTKTGAVRFSREVSGLVRENRELTHGSVVRDITIALQGIKLAVHEGTYTPPRLDDLGMDGRYFSVDVSSDTTVAEMLSVYDHPNIESALQEKADAAVTSVAARHRIDVGIARAALDGAMTRVIKCARGGALRYVDLNVPTMYTKLLFKALSSEVASSHAQLSDAPFEIEEDETLNGQLRMTIDQYLKIYAHLSDNDRRLVAMHGILSLTIPEIANVHRSKRGKAQLAVELTRATLGSLV